MTATTKNIQMFYIFRKYSFTFFVEGPWSPYKKCKNLFFFSFYSFYIFLSITAYTIKYDLKRRNGKEKHSRYKFHFSEIHGSMNTTDHVQSKWCPMHCTRCFHTSVNIRKIKFISYITLCSYIVFVHYLWNFDLNLASTAAKKHYNTACLVITFNNHHYDVTSIERYVGQSTIAFIYDVAYA